MEFWIRDAFECPVLTTTDGKGFGWRLVTVTARLFPFLDFLWRQRLRMKQRKQQQWIYKQRINNKYDNGNFWWWRFVSALLSIAVWVLVVAFFCRAATRQRSLSDMVCCGILLRVTVDVTRAWWWCLFSRYRLAKTNKCDNE